MSQAILASVRPTRSNMSSSASEDGAVVVIEPQIDDAVVIDLTKGKFAAGTNTANATGVIITFKDLTYTVKHRKTKEDLNILSSISGFFKPGQMSALMGPSGSGKTTLLDVISGRKTVGSIAGDVRFQGHTPTKAFLKRHTGYVEQFDTLLDSLTVYEMMLYTAELKLEESVPLAEKKQRVEDMIMQLQLSKCRDTRIGSALERGISGGQAKRVNIGIALITDPDVLFLDEPTSGLDSHTATEVMAVVKALTTSNRTVVATIHSPSAYTFRQFDTLMLLLDGHMAYFGPNGVPAVQHFIDTGLTTAAFSANDNEAEWIMEVTSSAATSGQSQSYADAYAASSLAKANLAELDACISSAKGMELTQSHKTCLQGQRRHQAGTTVGFFKAASTLFKYRTLRNYRDSLYMGSRLGDKVMVVLILMTLYLGKADKHSPQGISDTVGMLFLWTTLASFGATSYMPSLLMERALFYRESADGLYTVATYLFEKMFEELLLSFVATGILSVPVYYAIGLSGSLFAFWMAYFVTLSAGIACAYLVAALAPNMDVATAALPAYMVSLLYFSGLVMNLKSIPDYWGWYSRVDFVRYGFTALMVNQWEDKTDLRYNGKTILDFFGMQGQDKWANLGYQFCFTLAFSILAYLALVFVRHNKR